MTLIESLIRAQDPYGLGVILLIGLVALIGLGLCWRRL